MLWRWGHPRVTVTVTSCDAVASEWGLSYFQLIGSLLTFIFISRRGWMPYFMQRRRWNSLVGLPSIEFVRFRWISWVTISFSCFVRLCYSWGFAHQMYRRVGIQVCNCWCGRNWRSTAQCINRSSRWINIQKTYHSFHLNSSYSEILLDQ